MNSIKRLQGALSDAEYEAFIITSPINRRFVTGFPSSAGMAAVSGDGAWFFTDFRYLEAAKAALPDAEVRLSDRDNPYTKLLNDLCAEMEWKTLAFEDAAVTFAEYKSWNEKLTAELTAGSSVLSNLRMVKSAAEADALIRAQRLAEDAFRQILPLISTGITEKQLAAELVYAMLKLGADNVSFDPIVVSGPRSSLPHGVPTNAKISRGMLTIDFGVVLDGWCSDTTRTVCVGEPEDEEKRVYDIVLEAQLAGIEAAKAGAAGCEIDSAAREVIKKAGYGEYFGHSFGHGLGMEVHEAPNASQLNVNPIPDGAVISAEPGIYLPGRFGVRIEDILWVRENGSVNIVELDKNFTVI